ncbi:lamin-A-like [Mugil cephalus]|uniref:lamin-A-like n=1 Tax=Mugil cephalus TaxID=48193 RepID=UPI001FB7E328|nr:lamin-A-like [Mugil cephalus]
METRNKELETRNKEMEEIKDEYLEPDNYQTTVKEENSSSSDSQETLRDVTVVVNDNYKFICLRNTSDQDKSLEGRQLKVQINDSEPITYTFDSSMELKAGKILTICPSDYDESFGVPCDLVWKFLEPWKSGDRVQVSLQ